VPFAEFLQAEASRANEVSSGRPIWVPALLESSEGTRYFAVTSTRQKARFAGVRSGRCRWVGVLLATATLVFLAGCGPSEDDIRADIAAICEEMVADLGELPADPPFTSLVDASADAASEIAQARFEIEDLSPGGDQETDVDALLAGLLALDDAYDALGEQIEDREYASLAQTQQAGDAALANVVAAAPAVGVPDCEDVGVRADYFAIGVAGAEAAAAAIAPTGDYTADVNAACDRFTEDTFEVMLRLNLRAQLDIESTPDAGQYLEAIEDIATITGALDVLVRDLEGLQPPAASEAAATELIAGYEAVKSGFEDLDAGGSPSAVADAAQRVEAAASTLGVNCTI
jgi:hypothetical protein